MTGERKGGNMRYRCALISNIIFEPYWRSCLIANNCHVQTEFISYENFREDIDIISNVDIVVVCLNIEALYPDITIVSHLGIATYDDILQNCVSKCKELYSFIKKHTASRIIWFGFEDFFSCNDIICGAIPALDGVVDQMNLIIRDILKGDVYVDLKRLISTIGISNSYNIRDKYRWNAPYSKELIQLMSNEVQKQYLIHAGITKKCLVLDCDNVLWGGILSEDGIEGICISNSGKGRSFQDFQRFILDMYFHGVILTVCSKNDEADILKVFREHSGMILKEEHISCFCCNWNDKPSNIKVIAESLNIGLDSIVFVDDSLFEIEAVKSMLPEVATVLYHRDTVYNNLTCFNLHSGVNLQTIEERTNTYKTNLKREHLRAKYECIDSFVKALGMNIDIHETSAMELGRIAELTQRANKCTNGIRYTVEEIKNKISCGYVLLSVSVSDKFSNLGIVGAIGIENDILDLFVLSCRALGRNIEKQMIEITKNRMIKKYRYKDTTKNQVIFDELNNCFAYIQD